MSDEKEPIIEEEVIEDPDESMRVAYLVGLDNEGNFVFNVFGKEKGLVEVLGLHQLAGHKLKQMLEQNTNTGDKLTAEALRLLLQINNKIDKLPKDLVRKKI